MILKLLFKVSKLMEKAINSNSLMAMMKESSKPDAEKKIQIKKGQSKSLRLSERWLEQAEADLDAARDSLQSKHFEWSCFQAQQAAEKALKAFLYSQGLRAIITHSITELLLEAQKYAPIDITTEQTKTLDSYYIPTRYPNGLPGKNIPARYYSKEDGNLCINYPELILKNVKKYMKN